MKTDQQLKSDVTAELVWDRAVNSTRIGVAVSKGVVTLKQRANPQDIRAGIESALTRHAQREARHIAVDVDGGVVTLRGEVASMAERDAVTGTARTAKGVIRVIDQLEVVG